MKWPWAKTEAVTALEVKEAVIVPDVGQRWVLKGESSPWSPPRVCVVYKIAPGWVQYGFHGPDDKMWEVELDYFLRAYRPEWI